MCRGLTWLMGTLQSQHIDLPGGAIAHAIPRMSETSGIWPRPGKVDPSSVPGVGILSAP